MDVLVDGGVVLQPVNPVDENVVPDEEHDGRDAQPPPAQRVLVNVRVEHAVPPHLGQEEGHRQDVDPRHGGDGRPYLLAYLVLEEARVVLQPPVEYEVVRQRAKGEVQERGAHLCDGEERHDLSQDAVARPRHVIGDDVAVHLVQDQRVQDLERGVHG